MIISRVGTQMSVVKDDVEDEIISPQKDHAIQSNFF